MDIISTLSITDEQPSETCEEVEVDPAEYLFKEEKFHDWFITVGDPASDKTAVEKFGVASSYLLSRSSFFRKMVAGNKLVDKKNLQITNVSPSLPYITTGNYRNSFEKFGVASSYLLSRSSFFRKMVAGNKLVDKKNLQITNVSPAVFKLVLTFVYGGKLVDVDRSTAAQLALTADSYKMADLVKEACKLLVPTCVEEVFPALWCVAYIHCPDLEPHVTKIIQEETKCVVERKEFLDLDSKCVEFIAKQEKLGVSELDLWKALVKWAQFKALSSPEKSMREHLQSTLQFVRLTTLSHEEIIKEVMTTKILTPAEGLELLTAIASNQPWEVPGFCKTHKSRDLSSESTKDSKNNESKLCTSYKFVSCGSYQQSETLTEEAEYKCISVFTVKTHKDIEIKDFTFKTMSIAKIDKPPGYKLSCNITVCKIESGFVKETQVVQVGGFVVGEQDIAFPLKLRNGQRLRLEANSWYTFTLEFPSPHPAYRLMYSSSNYTTTARNSHKNMTITFNTPLHVKEITYNA